MEGQGRGERSVCVGGGGEDRVETRDEREQGMIKWRVGGQRAKEGEM